MVPFGWTITAIGVWITYCGYYGVNPITTLLEIIRNPGNASEIITGQKQPLDSSGNPVSGSGVVAFARAQIGKPYQFGAYGPDAYDCSGLTMAAYQTQGITLPHSASAQMLIGQKISRKADLLPGDLLFPSVVGTVVGGHVQIYSGGGNIIEAAKPGTLVRERAMWGFPTDSVRGTRPLAK